MGSGLPSSFVFNFPDKNLGNYFFSFLCSKFLLTCTSSPETRRRRQRPVLAEFLFCARDGLRPLPFLRRKPFRDQNLIGLSLVQSPLTCLSSLSTLLSQPLSTVIPDPSPSFELHMSNLSCIAERLIPHPAPNATRCECQVFYRGPVCEERYK